VAVRVDQSAFTIVAPVARDAATRAELRQQLQRVDPVLNEAPELSFEDFPELHYCSFVLVEDDDDPFDAPHLAFEGNLDGDVEPFLRALEERKEWLALLDAIYRCCEGYEEGKLATYLLDHDVGPGTWYVAFRGRSAAEIRNEARLREQIETFLGTQAAALRGRTPAELRAAIQEEVRRLGQEEFARSAPVKPFLLRYDRRAFLPAVGVLAVAFLPVTLLLLGAGGLALLRVRQLERSDAVDPVRWDRAPIQDSEDREDRTFQNHMCSVTRIKQGWLRPLLLRTSLTVVGLAHRLYFNRGDLGGIPTIHFARWVVLGDRGQVVFFSNFDGSWERYLGDFVEQARIGLNAIWSNAEGYPRTTNLVQGGAEDEERFKAFARNSMHRTRVWYSAYRNLSIPNIADNAKLREGLFAELSPDEVDEWLRLL
jgi:hypothetical protein